MVNRKACQITTGINRHTTGINRHLFTQSGLSKVDISNGLTVQFEKLAISYTMPYQSLYYFVPDQWTRQHPTQYQRKSTVWVIVPLPFRASSSSAHLCAKIQRELNKCLLAVINWAVMWTTMWLIARGHKRSKTKTKLLHRRNKNISVCPWSGRTVNPM